MKLWKKEHAQKHRHKRRQGASNGRNEWMRQCKRRSRRPGKDQDETAISAGRWSQKGGVIRDQEGSPAWEDKKGKAREDPLPAACQQRGPIRRTQRCSRIQLGWKIELTAAQPHDSLRGGQSDRDAETPTLHRSSHNRRSKNSAAAAMRQLSIADLFTSPHRPRALTCAS